MPAPHYHSHVDDPAAVGQRLRDARLAAGLSQRGLSFPGCSAAYVSRLESGDRVPSLQLLRKLALKLGADEVYLATGIERVEQDPPELVEAEIAQRLGDRELAEHGYEHVLETIGSPAVRSRAAQGLALLRGETVEPELDEPRPAGGLEDPSRRARALWEHSRTLQARGERGPAARYARDALALLEYADDLSAIGGGATGTAARKAEPALN